MIISTEQAEAWAQKAERDARDYEAKAEMLSQATVEGGRSGVLLSQEFRSAAHHLKEFAKRMVAKK